MLCPTARAPQRAQWDKNCSQQNQLQPLGVTDMQRMPIPSSGCAGHRGIHTTLF